MERAKCKFIKLILSDEGLVKKVKEWISRREEIQQASVAASHYQSLDLENFLASSSGEDFDQMMQDLDIERASTLRTCAPRQNTRDGLASASSSHVPIGLNDEDNDDVLTSRAVLNVLDGDNNEQEEEESKTHELMTEKTPIAPTCNLRNPVTGLDVREQKSLHKRRSPEKEVTAFTPALSTTAVSPGGMDMTESNDSQTSDSSSLESFRSEENGNYQNSVEGNLYQPSLEAADRSRSPGSSSDESTQVRSSRVLPGHDELASGRATEHASTQLGEGLNQPDRPLDGIANYQQHAHGLGPETLGDNRQSGLPGLNPPQLPATGLQSAAQITVGQLQNPNSPHELNLQNPNQIPPDTLHAIVMMLNRELMRRGNQPTRCDSCANLQTEIKNLRKSCRCLGQQLELLKWNYILLEEVIKNLEEMLKQKEDDNKESLKIILHFHEKLVERKNELSNLRKEIEVMRNKFDEERKQVYERTEEEEKRLSQLYEEMIKQTEMLQKVNDKVSAERHEKQVLQDELKQKSEESSDLQNENQLLKEENKVLKAKLEILEEERRKEREANQVLQEEYNCREAQFNERINLEIKQLMELFDNLKQVAQKHRFCNSLATLNRERENDDNFPSP